MDQLKCFIACAFGKEDIDTLYENAILDALNQLNIKALRVDRINHNENIDRKIIDLINNSDFGIADLTYARPSVYFESGLLDGQKKPVIYLARNDHFSPVHEDLFGNYKIHFDLITKNIIPWDTIDSKLIKKLKQRIKLVCGPLWEIQNIKFKYIESRKAFNSLSIDDRISILKKYLLDFIKSNLKKSHIVSETNVMISLIGFLNNIKYKILFLIGDSFSKKLIASYSPSGDSIWIYHRILFKDEISHPNLIIIFISLNSIRTGTIDRVLFSCKKLADKIYECKIKESTYNYLFIDNIDSQLFFEEKLVSAFKNFDQ